MSHVCRAFRPAAIALCVVIALAGSALAQTDVTTARIAGVVKDASASPLPGVTVEAKSQETGFTATAVTDKDGSYRLVNLPTGRYTLKATLEGMNTISRPDVAVKLGSAPTINFTMAPAAVSDQLFERATREWRTSPRMTTFRPFTEPPGRRSRIVYRSSSACVGWACQPSPPLRTEPPKTSAARYGAPDAE